MRVGLCADYTIGELMDVRVIESALRRRAAENKRKQKARRRAVQEATELPADAGDYGC